MVEAEVDGGTRVLNLIQVFQRIGLDRLKAAVKTPLKDLKPACYYGCLLVRPPAVVEFDDAEQPQSMEAIAGRAGRQAGGVELQDRVLRRRHDHGEDRDRAGAFRPDSGRMPWRTAPTAWWWPAPCAT